MMKKLVVVLPVLRSSVLVVLLAVFVLLLPSHCAANEDEERPNFIFVFADDVGFGDLRNYGHPYAVTDNLDRLAAEGTSFRQFHTTGNVCPTSRAGFMTSRNPSWFPNYTNDYGFLGTQKVTKILQDAGYTVGHIGKWNIGPTPDGDHYEPYGIDDLRITADIPGDPRGREGLRFDEAIDFVEQNQNAPFYLNVWIYATHTPIAPPDELLERFNNLTNVDRDLFGVHTQKKFDDIEKAGITIEESMRQYLADVYGMDLQIGRLLDKLDELDLADNTVVVFSSDNGPERVKAGKYQAGWAGGLRGEKHSWYEGGVRTPFIVRWPGHVPANKVNDHSVISALDWLPTVASIAGADVPWDLVEGEDITDIWKGSNRSRTNAIFYRNLRNHKIVTMLYGGWKVLAWRDELYDLETDPYERNNLYDDCPAIAEAMIESIRQWQDTLPTGHARLPGQPLSFDPMAPVRMIEAPRVSEQVSSQCRPFSDPSLSVPDDTCDSKCPIHLTCVKGKCRGCKPPCSKEDGLVCRNRECVDPQSLEPDTPPCQPDCPIHLTCVEGRCLGCHPPCSNYGLVCRNLTCVDLVETVLCNSEMFDC